jgi:very-short-patch-repair endonuclease
LKTRILEQRRKFGFGPKVREFKLPFLFCPKAENSFPSSFQEGSRNIEMTKDKLHTKKELAGFRSELRANLTPAEAFLWKQLSSRKLEGRRFTRQHSISKYVVDFYCAAERLIVELDGEVHNNPIAEDYDEERTTYFKSMGYKVIRFENKMVFDNLESVLKEIKDNFKS